MAPVHLPGPRGVKDSRPCYRERAAFAPLQAPDPETQVSLRVMMRCRPQARFARARCPGQVRGWSEPRLGWTVPLPERSSARPAHLRRPLARLIVAWSSPTLRERFAVALSYLVVLLGHSAGVREHLRPSPAVSMAVQRSLQAWARPKASVAVGPKRLYRPRVLLIAVQATGARESSWARMHQPMQALPEARSVAVHSYPSLDRFAAGWWAANLGQSCPMKPGRQARGTEELGRSCSRQPERLARKALPAWAYRCRGRESVAAVADPEQSALCRHLAWCRDRLRAEWGSCSA